VDLKEKDPNSYFCGMNSYNGDDQTVQVVLKGASCQFVIQLIQRVQVTSKLNMSFDDFLATDGPTSFVDNVAALLKVSPSRIKVTKIVRGSVVINFSVLSSIPPVPKTPEEDPTN